MSKQLVIVESPTKVRTIKKYLGRNFDVAATVGHIKDLPEKELGIDVEDGFAPVYETIKGKEKVIRNLKKAAQSADTIYLAPDPDREGEAIAWHTAEVLKKKGRTFHRVLFHELTESAIKTAMSAPEPLNRERFESQQARRILDRLVGYQISPILWRKIKRGLSAGRVQSVAVRIVCEREREIERFVSEESWSITAGLEGEAPPPFTARLIKKDGKKIITPADRKKGEKITIPDEATAGKIVKSLEGHEFTVLDVVKKRRKRYPYPPFTTSKLQQDAINRLRFSAKKTMVLAQQLYEGVDLGPGEPVGLITYMRTDSTRVAPEAVDEARSLIKKEYGKEYLPNKPVFYKNRKKVQDAHEAIRPTAALNTPERVASFLSADQLALYRLIWQRFVASQMNPALIDQTSVTIRADSHEFLASGSVIGFNGFMALYTVAAENNNKNGKNGTILPQLHKDMVLKCLELIPKQHFTQPPPRFSEASLVKELEENGIGRPSTYAAILSTIQAKGYTSLEKRYFRPTELGFIVTDFLVENFPDVLNVDFTARMEENLDEIAEGKKGWVEALAEFYGPFKKVLKQVDAGIAKENNKGIATDIPCPECREQLRIKVGKNGPFLACPTYPKCTFTSNFTRDEKGGIRIVESPKEEVTDEICEKCGKPMVRKQGRYGPFLACSGYPDCKNTRSLNGGTVNAPESTGVVCPEDGCDGELLTRRSRRGKIFYGCSRYPECNFAIWNKPLPEKCPECGAPYLVEKSTKKKGQFIACPNKKCKYEKLD
ncbi:MAG: type I DNA topoisomerase [Deltaproteobacteria bacterium]|nr:type I DNA topoisomerase [Deltaproteobacteria bacterium]